MQKTVQACNLSEGKHCLLKYLERDFSIADDITCHDLKNTSFSNACFWHDLAFWDLTTVEMRPGQKQTQTAASGNQWKPSIQPSSHCFSASLKAKRGDGEQTGGQEYKTAETHDKYRWKIGFWEIIYNCWELPTAEVISSQRFERNWRTLPQPLNKPEKKQGKYVMHGHYQDKTLPVWMHKYRKCLCTKCLRAATQ